MITADQFTQATGREPTQDDLERCNCIHAGMPSHLACGWCVHEKPVFQCNDCYAHAVEMARC